MHDAVGVINSKGEQTKHALPQKTQHLYDICTTSAQRLRRWSYIVHILYKCFVFVFCICWVEL